MGNFSKDPLTLLQNSLSQGYVGVHVEQGVPVLDRDLNLLGDLIMALAQQIAMRHIGNGIAGTTDFAIQAINNNQVDLKIAGGTCLVDGILVTLSAAGTTYATQTVPATASPTPLPALTPPVGGLVTPRLDTVYLDVWMDEITDAPAASGGDPSLGNPTDVGVRTSTRQKVSFVVRVSENVTAAAPLPAVPTGHHFYSLAQLSRASGSTAPTVQDLRQKNLVLSGVEKRMQVVEALLAATFAPPSGQFSPQHIRQGQAGAAITIYGTNFTVGTVQVYFVLPGSAPPYPQGTLATGPGITNTNTQMTVNLPTGSAALAQGTYQVLLTSPVAPAGVLSTDQLTIIPPPPPPAFVKDPPTAQFTPQHVLIGQPITINGTNLTGTNLKVWFGANVATAVPALPTDITLVSLSQIVVNVPIALAATAGTAAGVIPIMLQTDDGGPVTSTDMLTVVGPAFATFTVPGTQFTPIHQHVASVVIIMGTNLNGANLRIWFGPNTSGVPALATDIVAVTAGSISVKVPAALAVGATVPITIQTAQGGPVTSTDVLTVIA